MTKSKMLELANTLAEKYADPKGFTDVEKLAYAFNIPILSYYFESESPASLVFRNKKPYIILNNNPDASSDAARVRFSIAHELGHYFITEHKSELLKGNSLFVGNIFDEQTIIKWEKEADAFAAKLLLPTKGVKKFIDSSEITLELIERVSDRFKVSTEAAALNLIQLSETDQVLIKWRHKKNNYKSLSKNLYQKLKRIQKHRIEISNIKLFEVVAACKGESVFSVEGTVLSDWFEPITTQEYSDKFKAEAKENEGFGGMILLTAV